MIYFIRSTHLGQIKIGTTLSLAKRAAQLTREHKDELEVLAVLPGDQNREFELHHRFGHLRMEGEWFDPGPDLLEFIREHGRPWSGVVEELPDQSRRKPLSHDPVRDLGILDKRLRYVTLRLFLLQRSLELLATYPENGMDRVVRSDVAQAASTIAGLCELLPAPEEKALRLYNELGGTFPTRKRAAP